MPMPKSKVSLDIQIEFKKRAIEKAANGSEERKLKRELAELEEEFKNESKFDNWDPSKLPKYDSRLKY